MMGLKSLFGKTIKLTVFAFFVFALSLNLLIVVQFVLSPFQVVRSHSMSPEINTGDAVVMRDAGASDIAEGNIVIFRDPDEPENSIIHRIVEVSSTESGGTRLITKGDANPVIDPFEVSDKSVRGAVWFVLPGFGNFLDFLQSAQGYYMLVIVPFFLFIAYTALSSIREKARLCNSSEHRYGIQT